MSITTAAYDLDTDTIKGCEPYTLVWWHEKGHQWLEHKFRYHSIEQWVKYNVLLVAVGWLAMGWNKGALGCVFFILGWTFAGELFAWLYAVVMDKIHNEISAIL